MDQRKIPLKPTRRALIALRLNHAIPAFVLLFSALEGLTGESHGGSLLTIADLIVGGTVLFMLVREIRRGEAEGHRVIEWFDVVAGLVIMMEGVHHYNPRKGFQPSWLYFAIGVFTMLLGVFHEKIPRRRGLFITAAGFLYRYRIIRNTAGRWQDLERIDQLPRSIGLVWKDGRKTSINLRLVENREEVRTALQTALDEYRLEVPQGQTGKWP